LSELRLHTHLGEVTVRGSVSNNIYQRNCSRVSPSSLSSS